MSKIPIGELSLAVILLTALYPLPGKSHGFSHGGGGFHSGGGGGSYHPSGGGGYSPSAGGGYSPSRGYSPGGGSGYSPSSYSGHSSHYTPGFSGGSGGGNGTSSYGSSYSPRYFPGYISTATAQSTTGGGYVSGSHGGFHNPGLSTTGSYLPGHVSTGGYVPGGFHNAGMPPGGIYSPSNFGSTGGVHSYGSIRGGVQLPGGLGGLPGTISGSTYASLRHGSGHRYNYYRASRHGVGGNFNGTAATPNQIGLVPNGQVPAPPQLQVQQYASGTQVAQTAGSLVVPLNVAAQLKEFYDQGGKKEKSGELGEATQTYRNALDLAEKQLGSDHPETANIRMMLGAVELKKNDPAEAEKYYHEAVASMVRFYGTGAYELAPYLSGLGDAFFAQGKLSEAANEYRQVMLLNERKLGENSTLALNAAIKLARVKANSPDKGDWTEANELLSARLSFAQNSPDNALRRTFYETYLMVLLKESKSEEAASIAEKLEQLKTASRNSTGATGSH